MKVAVVGAGISGLGAAHLLSRAHDVEVFGRAPVAGGHANTVERRVNGRTLGLDTGFLVSNERNYPLLRRLFAELGVELQESEMSFSVGCSPCGLEYSGRRASPDERRLLGSFAYTTNDRVLHTDASLLPRTERARASWNFRLAARAAGPSKPAIT